MLKLLVLLLVLSTTAFASDGNGIERGSFRGFNVGEKIPEDILSMIEEKVLQRCNTSRLSGLRVESVEIEKSGFDDLYVSDVNYTVVLRASDENEDFDLRIYVDVIDASKSTNDPSFNSIFIDVTSSDIFCE
jgi:hypothetical protein